MQEVPGSSPGCRSYTITTWRHVAHAEDLAARQTLVLRAVVKDKLALVRVALLVEGVAEAVAHIGLVLAVVAVARFKDIAWW